METLTLRPGEDQAGRRADVWLSEAVTPSSMGRPPGRMTLPVAS